jgi:tellurite resistance protein
MATWDASLDPEIAALVNAAFDKSWQFVKTDPELAHSDPQEMRIRLAQSLARLAQNGERMWRLANAAIGQLRRDRSAAWHAHPRTS